MFGSMRPFLLHILHLCGVVGFGVFPDALSQSFRSGRVKEPVPLVLGGELGDRLATSCSLKLCTGFRVYLGFRVQALQR